MLELGRTLVFLGVLLILIGAVVILAGKFPGVGRLPGDILVQRRNFTFYFPIATSILISLLLSLFFWLLGKR